MKVVKNKFGEGELYDSSDLKGKIYARCCACMSVLSDFLSWANLDPDRFVKTPEEADTIIILGCQVTDLAVLNDLRHVESIYESLMGNLSTDDKNTLNKDIFMGGCLAQRFDIELPPFIKRLNVIRDLKTSITNRNLVDYAKPFWVKDFKDTDDNLSDGNLFRNMYPLKIGAGCQSKCKYCNIRFTRGETYEQKAYDQLDEFLQHDNVVLISDNPTVQQIKDWCDIAIKYNKPFSIRNVEPQNAINSYESLLLASKKGVLKIFHCPIQSSYNMVLKIMNRNVNATQDFINKVSELQSYGVIIATNIIIDYNLNGTVIPNHDEDFMKSKFDYYVWNPYWDGILNRKKAEKRFKKYLGL